MPKTDRLPLIVAGLLCCVAVGQPARAHERFGIAVDAGHGIRSFGAPYGTRAIGLRLRWSWGPLWRLPGAVVSSYGEFDVHRLKSDPGVTGVTSLTEVGVTPVLRLRTRRPLFAAGPWPYLEIGVGVHLLSHAELGNKFLSTAFQFGPLIGAGLLLGAHRQFEVGVRLQHLSNANIRLPNPGINLAQISLGYWFST